MTLFCSIFFYSYCHISFLPIHELLKMEIKFILVSKQLKKWNVLYFNNHIILGIIKYILYDKNMQRKIKINASNH